MKDRVAAHEHRYNHAHRNRMFVQEPVQLVSIAGLPGYRLIIRHLHAPLISQSRQTSADLYIYEFELKC